LIGDTIHNFADGVLIAITFIADPALGILTAIAIAAHELPQEFSDFTIMLSHGWGKTRVLLVNIFSALSSLIGAVLAYVFRDTILPYLPQLLAFTAGIFIYISVADLIPEISHESLQDKTWHVFSLLLLGILSVVVLGFYLEGH
jgi:zinc and cadmium transporter